MELLHVGIFQFLITGAQMIVMTLLLLMHKYSPPLPLTSLPCVVKIPYIGIPILRENEDTDNI